LDLLVRRYGEDFVCARMGKTIVFKGHKFSFDVPQHSTSVRGRFVKPLGGRWIRLYAAGRGRGRSGDCGGTEEYLYFLVSNEGRVILKRAEDDSWDRRTSAEVTLRISGGGLCEIIAHKLSGSKEEQERALKEDVDALRAVFSEVRDLSGFTKPRKERVTLRGIAEKYGLYITSRGVTASGLSPSYLVVSDNHVSGAIYPEPGPIIVRALPTFEGAVMFLKRMAEGMEEYYQKNPLVLPEWGGKEGGEFSSYEEEEACCKLRFEAKRRYLEGALKAGAEYANASRERALAKRFG